MSVTVKTIKRAEGAPGGRMKTQLEQIEEAAGGLGAVFTIQYNADKPYRWTADWDAQHPLPEDATRLVRTASRMSTAIEFLHDDLMRLGLIKEDSCP